MTPAVSTSAPDLAGITDTLHAALRQVEETFDHALRSDLPPVQGLVAHLETYRGKMLRPSLVILCGLAAAESNTLPIPALPTAAHITIAAVCEMIHMATLVHDDVLDEADIRRQGATVNRLRGNEAAVVLGDYIFSAAYRLCSTLDSQSAALLIGQTGMTLCAGELLQLHHRENFSIDEPTYFEIVRRKTGSLIAVACKLGAMQSDRVPRRSPAGDLGEDRRERAADHSEAAGDRRGTQLVACFEQFGMHLGVAFQIQDDLLDLTGDPGVVGKPLRKDAELGKLTLPIIHHLAAATAQRRGQTLHLLEDFGPAAGGGGKRLVEALHSTGSIEHARGKAAELVAAAKGLLLDVPESPARATLLMMADQVVSRSA